MAVRRRFACVRRRQFGRTVDAASGLGMLAARIARLSGHHARVGVAHAATIAQTLYQLSHSRCCQVPAESGHTGLAKMREAAFFCFSKKNAKISFLGLVFIIRAHTCRLVVTVGWARRSVRMVRTWSCMNSVGRPRACARRQYACMSANRWRPAKRFGSCAAVCCVELPLFPAKLITREVGA